jgi:hypothetical protein
MRTKKFFFFLMMICVLLSTQGNFQAQTNDDYVTLSILPVGNGTGTIVSSPPGIDCGGEFNNCVAQFPRSTPIQLSPKLIGPSVFHGWAVAVGSTNPCAAVRGECYFILMEDSSAQAVFVLD